jgi:hypothetical protein
MTCWAVHACHTQVLRVDEQGGIPPTILAENKSRPGPHVDQSYHHTAVLVTTVLALVDDLVGVIA